MTEALTTKLNNGLIVLAKLYKGEICAKTFVNRKQAYEAAQKVNGEVFHRRGPFYVVMPR